MKEILLIFQKYTGEGFLTFLYLLALLYLWVREKNKKIRGIFVYGTSVLQFLFFCPLFYYGYQLLDKGTYYRVLWLIPMTMTIAYVGTKILGRYSGFGVILGMILIAVSGKYVYSSRYISKAENVYHIPEEAVMICQILLSDEEEAEWVTGVFPDELIHFIRQYTSKIHMAYGRDYLAPDWIYGDHPLRQLMNQEEISVPQLAAAAAEYQCHYIILPKSRTLKGSLQQQNITKIDETTHYDIYRNDRVDVHNRAE